MSTIRVPLSFQNQESIFRWSWTAKQLSLFTEKQAEKEKEKTQKRCHGQEEETLCNLL